jgi:hypothetical protein
MSAFSKTIGGLDPWSMPSDGVNGKYIHLGQDIKAWERRQYSKARRREARQVVEMELSELDTLY